MRLFVALHTSSKAYQVALIMSPKMKMAPAIVEGQGQLAERTDNQLRPYPLRSIGMSAPAEADICPKNSIHACIDITNC
jgi:hypothetical protein